MQLDFHYYCIAVLARAAGFCPEDALVVGYASQYTDNATESGLIRLKDGHPGTHFDPVRTSYWGLETLHTLTWDAQKRVWIPFHFVPPAPFDPQDPSAFSFVTEPDSAFARLLLDQAAAEPLNNRERRLCRIGLALHTYADTWAHADFSGRERREENDVEAIYVYDRESGKWRHLKIENLILDAMPFIGHGQAAFFPDLAFQRWKFKVGHPEVEKERDNVPRFLEAARTIYDRLVLIDKANGCEVIPWHDIGPTIERLLSEAGKVPDWARRVALPAYRAFQANDVKNRCEKWKAAFAHLFEPYAKDYAFDELAWRKEALDGSLEWDDYSLHQWEQLEPFGARPGFYNSLWVHFHRAALRQRHFVLERLP